MHWRIKAQLTPRNQQRANQLESQINTRLQGRPTIAVRVTQVTEDRSYVLCVVDFTEQPDAADVWQAIQDANVNGWLQTPSWAGYAAVPDTPEDGPLTLLGRVTW